MKEYMRLESDSIGTMEVPEDAYYGVQALRAKENFPITGTRLHPVFIKNLAKIKRAAAITNRKAGRLKPEIANAIESACNEVVCGMFDKEFIVDGIQGGAGTSANMNMNEVIANRAIEMLCGKKGDYTIVHPNDHINMAQSTNDVIPTAGKLTVLDLLKPLDKSLSLLTDALYDKAAAFDHIVKIGRIDCCADSGCPHVYGIHFRADFCETVTVTGNHGGIRMERLTQTHRHGIFQLCTSDFYNVVKRCSFVI